MKKTFLSLVLASSVIVSSCLSAPLVSAEADTEQIKTLLEGFVEQNYKGDACINGYENGAVEVIFLDRPVGAPKLDTDAIYSEFDKFFKENNIDSSNVFVEFLEDSPVISDDTLITDPEQIKALLEGFIEQNYKGDAHINGYEDGVVEVIFRKTSVDEPTFDTNAIYSEFDKFFKENNIDSSKVFVEFLEDSPVISDDTLITDQEQIKTLLAGFVEQNYKGDAYIHDGEEDDVEVIFRKTSVEEPAFDSNAIYSEFDKFFKENNIDSSKVDVMFLEDSPVIPTSEKLGDINSDGKIDTTDLTELSLALIGDKDLTEDQQKAADLDKDGKAALSDLARMRQYLSKIIEAF